MQTKMLINIEQNAIGFSNIELFYLEILLSPIVADLVCVQWPELATEGQPHTTFVVY